MDEVRPDHVHAVEVEALEQRELLQRHRALAPRRLADRVVAVVVGERRLDAGLPLRHVLAGEHALVRRAADVHHLLRAAELVDRLGDEALRPDLARLLDLRDAVAAGALGFLQHARIGRGERLVGEHHALLGHLAAGQIHRGRGRPVLAEQLRDRGDGGAGALDQRMAVLRVGDRGGQHVGERHGAVVAQQQHPGVEHAGDAGGEQAGARHHVEALALVVRDGGAGRRRALAADDLRLAALHVIEDDRHVAARAVQVRLDHLQREGGGAGGVERVAALLQRRHADGGGDPVRRGDDAERALDLGPRGEGIGIDVACHGVAAGIMLVAMLRSEHTPSWPGLSRASRLETHGARHKRDARDKAGHDGGENGER